MTLSSSRLAYLALAAIFLIPLGMSSLRGLPHVLVCAEETGTPFTVVSPGDDQPPVVLSSQVIERDADPLLCGALRVDMGATLAPEGRVEIVVPITNAADVPWRGSVQITVDGQTVPLHFGTIEPGETAEDRVELRPRGPGHEVRGTLLIGP